MFTSRQDDFTVFRERYEDFSYQGFTVSESDGGISIEYHFEIKGLAEFRPTWNMPWHGRLSVNSDLFNNLAFHLGMVEMISYWKLTCSPNIHIQQYRLSDNQQQWWRKLVFKGLGEFRYLNGISIDEKEFCNLHFGSNAKLIPASTDCETNVNGILIPVGGGKDSAVSLHLLGGLEAKRIPFMINPVPASLQTVEVTDGLEPALVYRRTLDVNMLKLNEKGFLNGHTPFSALVAFSAVMAAIDSGSSRIALSNEASANEDTIPGTGINHQYSKSFEFEVDFRKYLNEYITPSVDYFSFLRPLSELAIASVFSTLTVYHSVFRSCNVGSKKGVWCGKCSKCLFAYLMLAVYLPKPTLKGIFGSDLLDDPALSAVLDELSGVSETKPFECIGTIEEVNAALSYIMRERTPGEHVLLDTKADPYQDDDNGLKRSLSTLFSIHEPNLVPTELLKYLETALNETVATRLDW